MGIAFKYPINSYESLEPCFRIGAKGSEMDVQMTKDSVLVLFHDAKLEDATLCRGILNDKTWDEIKNCLLASPYSNSVNLITLNELLSKIDKHNLTLTFDCKLYKGETINHAQFLNTYANAIQKVINDNQLINNTFIESSDTSFLRILKNKDANYKLFIYPDNFENGLTIANKMDLFGITISNKKITAENVKTAHEMNRRITVWNTLTESDNTDAVSKNVDYIQSDKIIHLLKMFGHYTKQKPKYWFKW